MRCACPRWTKPCSRPISGVDGLCAECHAECVQVAIAPPGIPLDDLDGLIRLGHVAVGKICLDVGWRAVPEQKSGDGRGAGPISAHTTRADASV